MRVINKANGTISKLWGEGKLLPTAYRLFTYVFTVEVEEGTLIHNAVTGELLLLSKEEIEKLNSLPCTYCSWMDELIKSHFLVRAELEDKKTVDALRTALSLTEKTKDITSYTILPTTSCNARCFYCYEAGYKSETMSDETADKLVSFMIAHKGDKTLHLNWFGGEPLMGIHQIDRISKALNEKKINFTSSMISNGYLFDEKIAKRAKKEWKLKRIQITLDGTEKVYNETKSYVNPCENPYERVLKNIEYLLKNNIRVSIRLNIGLHNGEDLTMLVEELARRFKSKNNLSIYTFMLFENCGMPPVHFDEQQKSLLVSKKRALDEQIHQCNKGTQKEPLPVLKYHRCMADSDTSLIVTPSGKLGKCEHYAESHLIGDVDKGITDEKELRAIWERETFDNCGNCLLYPNCINLKICVEKAPCVKSLVQETINAIAKSMKYSYQAFLHSEQNEEEVEETENC